MARRFYVYQPLTGTGKVAGKGIALPLLDPYMLPDVSPPLLLGPPLPANLATEIVPRPVDVRPVSSLDPNAPDYGNADLTNTATATTTSVTGSISGAADSLAASLGVSRGTLIGGVVVLGLLWASSSKRR